MLKQNLAIVRQQIILLKWIVKSANNQTVALLLLMLMWAVLLKPMLQVGIVQMLKSVILVTSHLIMKIVAPVVLSMANFLGFCKEKIVMELDEGVDEKDGGGDLTS